METKKKLAKESNLSYKQVEQWLSNRRRNKKKKSENNRIKSISIEQKVILSDFFFNKTRRPKKDEIVLLSELTGLNQKKISYWFTKKRYNLKKN